MGVGGSLRSSKGLKHCQNVFQTSSKVKKIDKVTVLFKSSSKADEVELTLRNLKWAFWVNNACMLSLNA